MEWRPVKYKGKYIHYEISDTGEVRNTETGYVLKQHVDSKGYMRVGLSDAKKGIHNANAKVHRLVATAFHVNEDNLPQVNHLDGDKSNNRADNLDWCTNKENSEHAWETGLQKAHPGLHGADAPWAKQSEESVRRACELLQEGGHTIDEISNVSGIPKRLVKDIKCGVSWKSISSEYDISEERLPGSDGSLSRKDFFEDVDKAIERGDRFSEISSWLMERGLTKAQARGLIANRKRSIRNGTSTLK